MARGILAVNFFKIFIDKSNMLLEHVPDRVGEVLDKIKYLNEKLVALSMVVRV